MSVSTERVCMLCGRPKSSSLSIYGPMQEEHGICGHTYCLLFANGLFEHGTERGHGRWDFPIENIQSVIEEAARKRCFVCSESGASITCRESGCDRSFHLPCATEGECITQFFPPYSSFCWEHRPQMAVDVVPEENTSCVICMEPVGDRVSYSTMVCPVCRNAWFHRSCIQENAIHAGIVCFVCPACRERNVFVVQMLVMGILIPLSLPSWITEDSPEPEERHSRCDARECLCPGGREQVEEEGSWQLLLCISCAAEGTHRACSNLGKSTTSWQCAGCSGPSTASSITTVLGGSSSPSQEAAGASGISPSQEAAGASGSSPSQEAAGASGSSPAQEEPRASSSSPSQEEAGASHSSPALASGRRSTPPGPMRVRDRSRSRRRAQNPYSRPRQRPSEPDSSESSSPGQAATEASSQSRLLQSGRRSRHSGSVRVRGRSRSGRQAQTPDSQPRQRRGRSRTTAPRAESSSPSQTAAGASRSSTAGNSSHRSSTGPVRVRDRSRLQRRAQGPYSRQR